MPFETAYFLLIINPKDHYWMTLGFDTFKIRYYGTKKDKLLKDKLEPRKKIAHNVSRTAQITRNGSDTEQKLLLRTGVAPITMWEKAIKFR
ncbi:hypothetical protein H4684_001229 [Desulfomicrobium macestii]|uniref:Uncharacterized protein n=1 Tax=Desulfomicrobium macestii TaxID=90731 RepID=A0ABR9H1L3_9BACT|nr:hypothetical protein [Desulfomicrobium macestii]MBE1424595.1 hypothetical protein [Desulfomicrobium macestii]